MNELKPAILVVEDDFVDLEIVKRGVAKFGLGVDILAASDGSEAIELMQSEEVKEKHPKLLVFLDINMPGMNGHQFLDHVRSDEDLRRTVVFVLTTSDHPRDIKRAYDNNVAGYFVKSNLHGLMETVSAYLNHVKFPVAGPRVAV